jgi:hypothetical protein
VTKQGGTTFTFVTVLLGDGVRLFDNHLAGVPGTLRCARVAGSPSGVTHIRYRVERSQSG